MNTEKYLASDGYYHYVYKITFANTQQYYYGQHSVLSNYIDNDKYMGSGKRLKECYQLSGYDNAYKEICCYASSFEELDDLEKQYIGTLYKDDPLCLNLIPGGNSTGKVEARKLGSKKTSEKFKNMTDEERAKWKQFLSSKVSEWFKNMPSERKKQMSLNISLKLKKYYEIHGTEICSHEFSEESKQLMSKHHLGELNSNFGNKWCYNPRLNISICVPEILWWDLIATGYIAGRKMNLTEDQRQLLSKKARENMIGKKCITDGKINKYINPDDEMPDGFDFGSKNKGKSISAKNKNNRELKKTQHKKEMYEKLKPMLVIFETLGFNEVVKQFNYKYTRNNLVQAFKMYIPEYVPNKHTGNTKAKQFQLMQIRSA